MDLCLYMQISSKNILFLIGLTSAVFLIAALFLIIYVMSYNRRKRKHANEKILLQRTFEHELLKTQMEVQEQTLKTIAYDLHDNIGQLLSLTTVILSTINLDDRQKSSEKIAAAGDLTKRSVKELRDLSRILHSEELLSRGLVDAIVYELEWLKRSDRFKLAYSHHFDQAERHPDKEVIVFRLFQEVISNIIKHARATEINIALLHDGGVLTLAIDDNGIGFDVAEMSRHPAGMGLQNMEKRAAMINGAILFNSGPGRGTSITITIPYT